MIYFRAYGFHNNLYAKICVYYTQDLFPFTVTDTEQCCIDFGVAYECLGLCYDLDISDDESNEYYYDIGSCETYAELIEFCQNP